MNYRTTKKRTQRLQTITEYDNNNKLLLSPLDKGFNNPRKNKEKHGYQAEYVSMNKQQNPLLFKEYWNSKNKIYSENHDIWFDYQIKIKI